MEPPPEPRTHSVFNSDPTLRRLAFTTPWGFLALGFGSGLFRKAPLPDAAEPLLCYLGGVAMCDRKSPGRTLGVPERDFYIATAVGEEE